MPKKINTFTQVEDSDTLIVNNQGFTVSLEFSGVATVALQRSFNGNDWRTIKEYTESSEETGEEPATGVFYRLSCTAHTDNVEYVIATKD